MDHNSIALRESPQIAAIPHPPAKRLNSYARVTTSLAPVAPHTCGAFFGQQEGANSMVHSYILDNLLHGK